MADLLIAISLMFAGAALALGGFALGQSVERRRWLEWTRPRKRQPSNEYGGWVGGRFIWREVIPAKGSAFPPSGGSAVRKPAGEARDA